MPLADFGNRIPQLQFEVFRNLGADDPDALENRLPGVALIPGAGEFIYDSTVVSDDDGEGTTSPENAHNAAGVATSTPRSTSSRRSRPSRRGVAGRRLVRKRPALRRLRDPAWRRDGGQDHPSRNLERERRRRAAAHLVSQIDGRPAYGGTPSDASVVSAICNLKARGLRVLFYPFLSWTFRSGNTLPDPYTGASGQGAFPWRGRITCAPAPGVSGSPDKTSAAATQVSAFFGAATAADFAVSGTTVSWTGGAEWSYRRMVLHYARLCAASGGIDAS